MADRIIDNPIINSPYRAPEQYFRFDDEGITNEKVPGRRPSQYFIPVPRPRKRGLQIELEFAEFTADKIAEIARGRLSIRGNAACRHGLRLSGLLTRSQHGRRDVAGPSRYVIAVAWTL